MNASISNFLPVLVMIPYYLNQSFSMQYNNQNFTMKNLEIESKREDNWKKYPYLFNENKNLSFECECGKKYVSFPGLYLHFQRKHGLKISTKTNPEECIMVNEGQKTTYKYMFESKSTKKDYEICGETSSGEKQGVSSVLQRFVENSQKQLEEKLNSHSGEDFKEQIKEVVVKFKKFIFENFPQKCITNNPQAILYQIPNLCNPFMQQISKESFSLEYQQICQILLQMGAWLKREGFSELILQLV